MSPITVTNRTAAAYLARQSLLSRPIEQPRTLAQALEAWLNCPLASRKAIGPARRVILAQKLMSHRT